MLYYDPILRGQRLVPESQFEETGPHAREGQAEVLTDQPEEETPQPSPSLEPPPPLEGVPQAWVLEAQRIASRLFPEEEIQRSDSVSECLAFVGVTPKSGVTTVSYLVAYHVASMGNNQRVLFAQFGSSPSSGDALADVAPIRIGDPFRGDFWDARQLLTVLPISSQPGLSVADVNQWVREFVREARQRFRWVILDLRPFSELPESFVEARVSDGVVLIVKSGETRLVAFDSLCSDLADRGIKIRGVVLTFREYPIPQWLLRYL